MTVDDELHEYTKYRIPDLEKQFEEAKNRIGSFIISCNEPNWDSYNAKAISIKTIKFSVLVLDRVYLWFEKNIGFLNNRNFSIWTSPNCTGDINIELTYDDLFECNIYVQNGKLIQCIFHPAPRFLLDGTKTIADRNFKMIFSGDIVSKKCKIQDLDSIFDEAFYKHKWKF